MADDAASSPKRKKVRAKYASRACVLCRKSKLKCSGENPCQRCVDSGKRCFYSEDQTAAEALQNLSRPALAQAPTNLATNDNGNGAARRNLLPRNEAIERRASDASVLGLSMEARMARIETMMESLMLERGMAVTPRISMERDPAASERLHADFLMQVAGEASLAALPPVSQGEFDLEGPGRLRQSISASSSGDVAGTLRVGNKTFVFPSPVDYQRYLNVFFDDIAPYYPCINEIEFRMRGERMLSMPAIQAEDVSLLALNYIIFACSEIATTLDSGDSSSQNYPPGWQWFRAADDLVGKRKMSGQADLCLIQFVILEAIYLMYTDKGNAAYNVIGIACRLCYQAGLHHQSSWRAYTPFDIHMRQRIFWTVYFLDRRISLSCGRPYSIRESDIDIEQPAYLWDKEIHPDQPLPDPNLAQSSNMYLNCMVCWGRLAADVWDLALAATVSKDGVPHDVALMLDARVKHWTENVLPTIPLLPPEYPPEPRQLRQHTIVQNSLDQLRLILFRQAMLTSVFGDELRDGCAELAFKVVQRGEVHRDEANQPTSFRFHLATSSGSAMMILAVFVSREARSFVFLQKYNDAYSILDDMASGFALARRIKNDFASVHEPIQQFYDPTSLGLNHADLRLLIPYASLDFAQQPGAGDEEVLQDGHANGSSSASTLNTDLWSSVFATKEGRYGVPWI